MAKPAEVMTVGVGVARFAGWKMLAVAFLAQNCALGVNFGAYGTLVQAIQTQFATSRALASSGTAAMVLVMGLTSPVVGNLMQRFSLRALMMTGASLCAAGYALLTRVHDIRILLGIYALVIGPGVCLLGVIPSSALVTNWFVTGRGRALGIVNMSFFMFLMPPIAASILLGHGLQATFATISAIFLCLVPLLALVVTQPSEIGQRALGAEAASGEVAPPTLSSRQILTSPSFIVLTLGIGFMTMAGVMMVTHLVSLVHDRGIELQMASMVMSAFGIASAVGGPTFGWLADRIGGRLALVTLSFGSILPWSALLWMPADIRLMVGIAATLGLFSGGLNPLLTAVMSRWMGQANFGRAMGLCYFLKVPFMFSAAPFAGLLYDLTGGYRASLIFHIATFVPVGIMFLVFRPRLAPVTG
jgi:MFS family permease